MAQCEFDCGMKNVRGTLATTRSLDRGQVITKRLVAKVTKTGKQIVYIQKAQTRTTPVTKREIAARARFGQAAEYFKNLNVLMRQYYHDMWVMNTGWFQGKQYKTLRGYVMARFIKDNFLSLDNETDA